MPGRCRQRSGRHTSVWPSRRCDDHLGQFHLRLCPIRTYELQLSRTSEARLWPDAYYMTKQDVVSTLLLHVRLGPVPAPFHHPVRLCAGPRRDKMLVFTPARILCFQTWHRDRPRQSRHSTFFVYSTFNPRLIHFGRRPGLTPQHFVEVGTLTAGWVTLPTGTIRTH